MRITGQGVVLVAALLACGTLSAQVPLVSEGTELRYDHSGMDVGGNPIQLAAAQAEIRNADSSIARSYDYTSVGQAGTTALSLAPLIGGLAEGDYWVRVRVQAANNQWSAFTAELQVRINRDAPVVPTNPVVPATITDASTISFDHSGLDANGDPISIHRLRVNIRNADLSVNSEVIIAGIPAGAGTKTASLATVVAGVTDGDYTLRIQVQGTNGVWSPYTLPFGATIARTAPAAPTNLRTF